MEIKHINWAKIRKLYRGEPQQITERTEIATKVYTLSQPKKPLQNYVKLGNYLTTKKYPRHKNIWDKQDY